MRPSRSVGRKGSMLLLALWVLVALSVMAVCLAQSARQKIRVFQRIEERQRSRGLCHSAVKVLTGRIRELLADSGGENREALFGLGEGALTFPEGTVRYRVSEESSRVNLNTCRPQTLRQLLVEEAHLGAEPADRLAFALEDYRDGDDALSVYYKGGSEKDLYRSMGLAYAPKNSGLELISEFQRVPGITKEIYNSMRDYVTIYGDGKVNVNTASKSVLIALDLPDLLAEKITSACRGDDGREGTADDRRFSDLESLRTLLRSDYALTPDEEVWLDHAIRHDLSTGGAYFTLILEARTAGGEASSRAVCVYSPRDGIVYWTES